MSSPVKIEDGDQVLDNLEDGNQATRVAKKEKSVADALPYLESLAVKFQQTLAGCDATTKFSDRSLGELSKWIEQKSMSLPAVPTDS